MNFEPYLDRAHPFRVDSCKWNQYTCDAMYFSRIYSRKYKHERKRVRLVILISMWLEFNVKCNHDKCYFLQILWSVRLIDLWLPVGPLCSSEYRKSMSPSPPGSNLHLQPCLNYFMSDSQCSPRVPESPRPRSSRQETFWNWHSYTPCWSNL